MRSIEEFKGIARRLWEKQDRANEAVDEGSLFVIDALSAERTLTDDEMMERLRSRVTARKRPTNIGMVTRDIRRQRAREFYAKREAAKKAHETAPVPPWRDNPDLNDPYACFED